MKNGALKFDLNFKLGRFPKRSIELHNIKYYTGQTHSLIPKIIPNNTK